MRMIFGKFEPPRPVLFLISPTTPHFLLLQGFKLELITPLEACTMQ
jgi:hypothetical protein